MQAPLSSSGLVVGGAAASVISGPKVFTDIAFEAASSGMQLQTQHIYVSTASGAVFKVDYGRRALAAVYQVHAAAINSLCIGEGLALTASDDTTLRLWPLEFSSYLLEAQHEAPVTSACLGSSDGLLLVAGCEDGSLGQLDVVSRQHTGLLRSHCGAVLDLAVHPTRPEYVTTSTDGSVRIWDASSHQQLLVFGSGSHVSASRGAGSSSGGGLCRASCAALNPIGHQLVVGFREGLVRLFDITTMQMLQERQQHVGSITQLLFTADASRLLSCGADGRVVVYAVHHGLLPVKALITPPPAAAAGAGSTSGKGKAAQPATINSKSSMAGSSGGGGSSSVCAAVSSDGCWIAVGQPAAGPGVLGPDGGSGGAAVVLFNAALDAVLHIECTAASFNRVAFSPDSSCIWALAAMPQEDADSDAAPTLQQPDSSSGTSSLFCFSVSNGSLLQQLPQPHGNAAVSSFALDAAGAVLATCGSDHLVKLWNVGPGQGPAVCQSFTAHHGAVAGAAFLGKQLLTVGADGNICIWALAAAAAAADTTGIGVFSAQNIAPAAPEAEEAAVFGIRGTTQPPQQQQEEQQQQRQLVGSEACGSLRSWLEPRRTAGATVGVAGGVAVAQQQPVMLDEGIEPSPLFTDPVFAHQQQQQQQSVPPSSAITRRIDPLLSCSAVLGLEGLRCGVLWLKQAGLLAYTASNTLILFDLATKQQSFLSHHRQSISALSVNMDAQLIATGSAAAEPAGGYADVAIWDVQRRCLVMLLQQHPVCVEQLAFSPDGAWLVSVGSGRVVVWGVATGRAIAVGAVKQAVSGIAWLPHRPLPSFVTCGGDGLLLWSLTPKFLEQRQLDIPDIALAVSAAAAAGSNQGFTQQCCQITAVCTAASSGGWAVDSLALPPPSAAAAAAAAVGCDDPVLQEQQREAAAVTVFAADSTGGVWQLMLGEGRLCSCVRVTSLPQGESATALQWSQPAAALAVGTSSGRLLRFTCSSSDSSSSSGRVGVHKGIAVSSGVETPVTPAQAVSQWWAAATGASGGSGAVGTRSGIPAWTLCTSSGSNGVGGSTTQQQQQQQEESVQLDGPIVRLCLEPHALCEGVVSAGAATAWYVDLHLQQKAPLLAGHTGSVNALVPAGCNTCDPLIASLGQDGRVAVWDASTGRADGSSSSRGMAQVPLAEWCCADASPTAAVFLPRQSATQACVLGHADGRVGLLELPDLIRTSSSSRGTSRAAVGASGSVAGVLHWCVVRHPSAVVGLALHPDQPLVMAASRDGLITTTHTGTGELVATCKDLIGTATPLHAFAVSTSAAVTAADGDSSSSSSVAAAAWIDKLLVFRAPWQVDVAPVMCSYHCPEVPEVLPAGIQSCVSFITGSSSLLLFTSPCLGSTALLFDFTVGQPLRQLALTAQPASLTVAPAGQLFAFGLTDGCVLLTDAVAESSLELRACGGSGTGMGTAVEGSRAVVQAVGFAAGGSKLLASVGGVITVWDA